MENKAEKIARAIQNLEEQLGVSIRATVHQVTDVDLSETNDNWELHLVKRDYSADKPVMKLAKHKTLNITLISNE